MVKVNVSKKRVARDCDNDVLPPGYNPKQVEDGVKALFQILENSSASKKSLFEDEGEFIRIQVTCVRIPHCRYKHYRFALPHGYLKDASEACLFVRNLSGKKDREYEDTVRHFKNLINDAGVKSINEVISINQLKQEYKTYEMKRRLASRFDVFLADAVISDWLHGCLGKEFHRHKKLPTPVRLHSKDLKGVINQALKKTTLTISGKGTHYMSKVGHTKQDVEHICKNIEAFVKGLKDKFPGKWGNVRSLHIRTDKSLSIPIYYSIVFPNTVKVPKVKPGVRGKRKPVVEGEISTLPDGYKVVVLPDGSIKVKGKKANGKEGWLNDDEWKNLEGVDPILEEGGDSGEEFMSDLEGEEEVLQEEAVVDSEKEEAGVEAAEEAYLKELSMGRVEEGKKRKSKEIDLESRTSVKRTKKTLRAKNTPVSTQWKVKENDGNVDSGVQENKEKMKKDIKKSKKMDKGLTPKQISTPEPHLEVKSKEKLRKNNKKVARKGKLMAVEGDVLNGQVKEIAPISKLGKKKKASVRV